MNVAGQVNRWMDLWRMDVTVSDWLVKILIRMFNKTV